MSKVNKNFSIEIEKFNSIALIYLITISRENINQFSIPIKFPSIYFIGYFYKIHIKRLLLSKATYSNYKFQIHHPAYIKRRFRNQNKTNA